jgi:hypothetical protein
MATQKDDNKKAVQEADQRYQAAEYLVEHDPALAAVVVAMWTEKHRFFLVQQTVMSIYSDALDRVMGGEKDAEDSEAEKFWEGKL